MIAAIVIHEPRHFVRLTFAPSADATHNGTFYTDMRELEPPDALSLEVWAWRDAQPQAGRPFLQWNGAHPPLSGCDVYGPVRQFWFPEAKGAIVGPDSRTELHKAAAVKFTTPALRVEPHLPLLSLEYVRSAHASLIMAPDTEIFFDTALSVAETRRELAYSPIRRVATVLGESLLAALLVMGITMAWSKRRTARHFRRWRRHSRISPPS